MCSVEQFNQREEIEEADAEDWDVGPTKGALTCVHIWGRGGDYGISLFSSSISWFLQNEVVNKYFVRFISAHVHEKIQKYDDWGIAKYYTVVSLGRSVEFSEPEPEFFQCTKYVLHHFPLELLFVYHII